MSAGSACTSGNVEPSYVLVAMGVPVDWAMGAVRCSLGRSTTAADIDYVIECVAPLVAKLRALSPGLEVASALQRRRSSSTSGIRATRASCGTPMAWGRREYPECMDLARFYLRVREGRVVEARFQTYGCGPTIAASSAATEAVGGPGPLAPSRP